MIQPPNRNNSLARWDNRYRHREENIDRYFIVITVTPEWNQETLKVTQEIQIPYPTRLNLLPLSQPGLIFILVNSRWSIRKGKMLLPTRHSPIMSTHVNIHRYYTQRTFDNICDSFTHCKFSASFYRDFKVNCYKSIQLAQTTIVLFLSEDRPDPSFRASQMHEESDNRSSIPRSQTKYHRELMLICWVRESLWMHWLTVWLRPRLSLFTLRNNTKLSKKNA